MLLGNGDGTFQDQAPFGVGAAPSSTVEFVGNLVVGDFNGDGQPDLAATYFDSVAGSGDVSVLLGNGDGTFRAQAPFVVGADPTSLVVGDFNGDGRPDLAVGDAGDLYFGGGTDPGSIFVFLGQGDGTFQLSGRIGADSPTSLVTGDFNGDGRPDLAAASIYSDDITVLLGNGDGTFRAQEPFGVGAVPTSLVTGDFDGDGWPDLAVADVNEDSGDGDLAVLLGNGNGTFQNPRRIGAGLPSLPW